MPGASTISDSESNSTPGGSSGAADSLRNLRRTLWWVGIAAASAAVVAYAVVRATGSRPPLDPTSERIQSLIDEANSLLRALDDKKRP